MPTYQNSYGGFFYKTVFPTARMLLVLVTAIALIAGSWVETSQTDNCSLHTTMSFFEVALSRNISLLDATPDKISLGLWRQCLIYARNCTCTPTRLNYELDALKMISLANQNNTYAVDLLAIDRKDTHPSTSYIRVVPLVMGAIAIMASFILSVWSYRRSTSRLISFIIAGLAFVSVILVAIPFGSTYTDWTKKIIQGCTLLYESQDTDLRCNSYSLQFEVILLAIAIGLGFLSCLFWTLSAIRSNAEKNHMDSLSEKLTQDSPVYRKPLVHKRLAASSPSASSPRQMVHQQDHDVLDVWRDVTRLEKLESPRRDYSRDAKAYYENDQPETNYERFSNPTLRPPPPVAQYTPSGDPSYKHQSARSNERLPRNQYAAGSSSATSNRRPVSANKHSPDLSPKQRAQNLSSTRYDTSYSIEDDQDLVPPDRPFARTRQTRKEPRPPSRASNNTFGANDPLRTSRNSSYFTSEDTLHQAHRTVSDSSFITSGLKNKSRRQDSKDSTNSSAYYTPGRSMYSSGLGDSPIVSNSSGMINSGLVSGHQRRRSDSLELTAHEEASVESTVDGSKTSTNTTRSTNDDIYSPSSEHPYLHPLNNKVIVDQRIGAYLKNGSSFE
ncbi:hypothetical protein CLU79DRAFT_728153 [Phycomyces nitens]|nr:hypothetical protein CLU79DRAFT_728153 [Phycomyces nitens]